jgi:hypothetical protein
MSSSRKAKPFHIVESKWWLWISRVFSGQTGTVGMALGPSLRDARRRVRIRLMFVSRSNASVRCSDQYRRAFGFAR